MIEANFLCAGAIFGFRVFFFFFAFIKFLLDKNQASTFMRGTVSFSFQCSAKIKKQ